MSYADYKSMTLLVLDDERSLLKFFKIHLGSLFSSVIVISDPKDAMDVIKSHPTDIVLSDYEMPDMSGVEVLKTIRAYDPTIPLILISGASLPATLEDQIACEFDGYLRKPFDISALSELLSQGVALRKKYRKEAEDAKGKVVSLADRRARKNSSDRPSGKKQAQKAASSS